MRPRRFLLGGCSFGLLLSSALGRFALASPGQCFRRRSVRRALGGSAQSFGISGLCLTVACHARTRTVWRRSRA
eukprot:1265627-Alexandrium_andersonii.AAC.1